MDTDLLDLTKIYLGDDVISQVSTMLGEDPSNTRQAFDGALPVLLNGLVQKSAEPGGKGAILGMVGQANTPDPAAGGITEPVGGLAGNLNTLLTDNLQLDSLLSMGSGMVQTLFGPKTGTVADALASYSGIKTTSATSLMHIAGPVLLSVLGRKMAADETGVSGLSALLASQQPAVQASLPAELRTVVDPLPDAGVTGGLPADAGWPVATPADPFAPSVTPDEGTGL